MTNPPSTAPDGATADSGVKLDFDAWITALDEDVIQGDFGYEDGEFTVFPETWRPLFDEGLTPAAAFRRALDALADLRSAREEARLENWRRIQAQDAATIARAQGRKP